MVTYATEEDVPHGVKAVLQEFSCSHCGGTGDGRVTGYNCTRCDGGVVKLWVEEEGDEE